MGRRLPFFILISLFLVACGGSKKAPKSGDDEKLVPEETQERSRELDGKQRQSMQDLSLTPAEQAAAQHEAATKPVDNPKYGKDEDDDE